MKFTVHKFMYPHIYYTPCKQSLGEYIGITLSVRPSMYLVSTTPPKPPIGFL